MPVWHARTREARESGALELVGIVQEQHPDRARLFAEWQGFDWPILWDPFGLSEIERVPLVVGVDEHGVVRATRLHPERFEEQMRSGWLSEALPEPSPAPGARPIVRRELAGDLEPDAPEGAERAMASLLWPAAEGSAAAWDGALALLEAHAERPEATPEDRFRLGVAHRLRHDSPYARPGDFQRALDAWTAALAARPNQYVWRRRIQQYGPRLDKPYAFYDWIEEARAALRARGETPVEVRVALSGSEVAAPSNELPRRTRADVAPDPEREIRRDTERWVSIERASALHTGSAGARVRVRASARVHLALRPDAARDVHWSNDAGPTTVWVFVPSGWVVEANLYTLPVPPAEISNEVRRVDFEVVPPSDVLGPAAVKGYALYYVCEGEDGECAYLRSDFEVPIPLPVRRGPDDR